MRDTLSIQRVMMLIHNDRTHLKSNKYLLCFQRNMLIRNCVAFSGMLSEVLHMLGEAAAMQHWRYYLVWAKYNLAEAMCYYISCGSSVSFMMLVASSWMKERVEVLTPIRLSMALFGKLQQSTMSTASRPWLSHVVVCCARICWRMGTNCNCIIHI